MCDAPFKINMIKTMMIWQEELETDCTHQNSCLHASEGCR